MKLNLNLQNFNFSQQMSAGTIGLYLLPVSFDWTIQSPSFPTLSPESPHLWAGMGEFSSCQRHFEQCASEKGTEGGHRE